MSSPARELHRYETVADETAPPVAQAPHRRQGLLARIVDAILESRMRQAQLVIDQHKDFIAQMRRLHEEREQERQQLLASRTQSDGAPRSSGGNRIWRAPLAFPSPAR